MAKIFLDPGHDINTPGKGVAGMKEFEFNRAVVENVYWILEGYENVELMLSHNLYDGIDDSLKVRTDRANAWGATCFVSVHANAASANSANGIETFVHPRAPQSTVNLGAEIQGELIRATGMNNRGLKKTDFAVLRDSKMDAFLAECGFMTNPGDLAKLKSDDFRKKCAQAIVNGLVKHYGLKKKPAPGSVPTQTAATTTGSSINGLNILYRVHIQDIGWTEWKKNGETAGTTGQSKRIEAIEIKLG
jgi:N-acetylmuramoyl-L-alanine amidase